MNYFKECVKCVVSYVVVGSGLALGAIACNETWSRYVDYKNKNKGETTEKTEFAN